MFSEKENTKLKVSKVKDNQSNGLEKEKGGVSMPAPPLQLSSSAPIQMRDWGSLGGKLINNSSKNIRFWTGDNAEERAGGSIHGTAEILPAHSSTPGDRDLDMFEWR